MSDPNEQKVVNHKHQVKSHAGAALHGGLINTCRIVESRAGDDQVNRTDDHMGGENSFSFLKLAGSLHFYHVGSVFGLLAKLHCAWRVRLLLVGALGASHLLQSF